LLSDATDSPDVRTSRHPVSLQSWLSVALTALLTSLLKISTQRGGAPKYGVRRCAGRYAIKRSALRAGVVMSSGTVAHQGLSVRATSDSSSNTYLWLRVAPGHSRQRAARAAATAASTPRACTGRADCRKPRPALAEKCLHERRRFSGVYHKTQTHCLVTVVAQLLAIPGGKCLHRYPRKTFQVKYLKPVAYLVQQMSSFVLRYVTLAVIEFTTVAAANTSQIA
jgi:hypothetical protein